MSRVVTVLTGVQYLVSRGVSNRCANELLQYLVSRGVFNRCTNELLQCLVSRGVSNRCANELLQYLVSRGLLLRGQPVSEQFLPDDQRSYCCILGEPFCCYKGSYVPKLSVTFF